MAHVLDMKAHIGQCFLVRRREHKETNRQQYIHTYVCVFVIVTAYIGYVTYWLDIFGAGVTYIAYMSLQSGSHRIYVYKKYSKCFETCRNTM